MTSTLDFPVTPAPQSDGFAQAELGFGATAPARVSHGIAPAPRGVSAVGVQPELGLGSVAPAASPAPGRRETPPATATAPIGAAVTTNPTVSPPGAAAIASPASAAAANLTATPSVRSGGRTSVSAIASVPFARAGEGVAVSGRAAVRSAADRQGPVSTPGATLRSSRSRTTSLHHGQPTQSATQDERGLVPAAPPSALGLLAQAEQGLTSAVRQPQPAARFAEAYLCALRAAAALLAARGRPHRGRSKPTSVWTLLSSVAPEMREWAAFFASCSTTRAAVQAGITSRVGPRAADDLVRQSGQFIALVHRAVHGDRR